MMGFRKCFVAMSFFLAFGSPKIWAEWTSAGFLESRSNHTATLLGSGKVLVVGGYDELTSVELYDPLTASWSIAASLPEPREEHTATTLLSGEVLIVGGRGDHPSVLDSCLIFNPFDNSWRATGSLKHRRHDHTATLLKDGRVLVVGGYGGAALGSVEIYDPGNEEWTIVSSLQQPRSRHTATRLASGEVLITGGVQSEAISLTEIYDPATGTLGSWRTVGSLEEARFWHTASLLGDGRVVVAGGKGAEFELASVEVFDPEVSEWETVVEMNKARRRHAALMLPNGEVLVIGGTDGAELQDCELFDPTDGSWRNAPSLLFPRRDHTATLLPGGDVLVVAGWDNGAIGTSELLSRFSVTVEPGGTLNTSRRSFTTTALKDGKALVVGGRLGLDVLAETELYNFDTGEWSAGEPLEEPRMLHSATLLTSGQVLVAGGLNSEFLRVSNTEIYRPKDQDWVSSGLLKRSRLNHTATRLANGNVLLVGGNGVNLSVSFTGEIFDSENGTWRLVEDNMEVARSFHTATLLQTGEVLVVGGEARLTEIFDPISEKFSPRGLMASLRTGHTATLLPSGHVLVVGGRNGLPHGFCEIYDPSTGSWTETDSLEFPRADHAAMLLPTGEVLVGGGLGEKGLTPVSSLELFDPKTRRWRTVGELDIARGSLDLAWDGSGDRLLALSDNLAPTAVLNLQSFPLAWPRPRIFGQPSVLKQGTSMSLWGTNLRLDGEAASGKVSQSSGELPLVQLQAWDGSLHQWITPNSLPILNGGSHFLTTGQIPPTLHPGPHRLRVFSNGVFSPAKIVEVTCSLEIEEHPQDQTVSLGQAAVFSVEAPGARRYRWFRDGEQIAGVHGSTYFTPPVTLADLGSRYRVEVDSGCEQKTSAEAMLRIFDEQPPEVEVVRPKGGEHFPLSSSEEQRTETISWVMSDNVLICHLRVRLLFSSDGVLFDPVPGENGVLLEVGTQGLCSEEEEVAISEFQYSVPILPPSGDDNSLYKIEVGVTDHRGLQTLSRSPEPFFFTESSPAVKTLILHHPDRMLTKLALDDAELDALDVALEDFAEHSKVQGKVIDLSLVESLNALYASWDQDTSSVEAANSVLFGAGGLRVYIEELLETFTDVKYAMLIGGDEIIPFARVLDRTSFSENKYVESHVDLTATGTTVGRALAENYYLSDDLLVALGIDDLPFDTMARGRGAFIPNLAIGRLVERPMEMLAAISAFIHRDGVVDLTSSDGARSTLVTGYDFLVDSGRRVCKEWERFFNLPGSCEDFGGAVNGHLLSADWGEATVVGRRLVLLDHLLGLGGDSYRVLNLNGHATHYQLGVPGNNGVDDIQGLSVSEISGPHACGDQVGVDLTGSLVYAVGCHAGLSVPGSCISDADHSLDMPQVMLSRGVLAFVANSGYGWGLEIGVGYSERLIELFTAELTFGGDVVVGEAVINSKERYYLESTRFDAFDEKTLIQWTFYGFPMTVLRAGEPGAIPKKKQDRRNFIELVERQSAKKGLEPTPAGIAIEDASFRLGAPELYKKYGASGDLIEEDIEGCPDPQGCYYTLNNLVDRVSGAADLPLQPFFVTDLSFSGASLHGVLWLGGTYREEKMWRPVVATLVSNGANFSNHGTTPRLVKPKPVVRRRPADEDEACRSFQEARAIVVTTGETLGDLSGAPEEIRQRIYETVDLDGFFLNDQGPAANCDRLGPTLGTPTFQGNYHRIVGETLEWEVSAEDERGVWRVVVVIDHGAKDGWGKWEPIELEHDGSGTWKGTLLLPQTQHLTYVIQAVDRSGNISWFDFESDVLPESGVLLDLPMPVDITTSSPRLHPADLDGDWRIGIGNVTEYIKAWRNTEDEPWIYPPNPIPIDYVTVAGTLWRLGEEYRHDSSMSPPWRAGTELRRSSESFARSSRRPVASSQGRDIWIVTIEVRPAPGTQTYAIEEIVPDGWRVLEVSRSEATIVDQKIIRWGPYFDQEERKLTYRVERAQWSDLLFQGRVSLDGASIVIERDDSTFD